MNVEGSDDKSEFVKKSSKLYAPILFYLFTNKKARLGVQKLCEELSLKLEDKSCKIYEDLDRKKFDEEDILLLRKISKYASERIRLNQLYPLDSWILDLKKSEYSKGTTNFEEFKDFYFKSDVLKGKTMEQRKKIALNDLLYETNLEDFKQDDFEKKLAYSIMPKGKENLVYNYSKMMCSTVLHLKNEGVLFFLGVYLLTRKMKVFHDFKSLEQFLNG